MVKLKHFIVICMLHALAACGDETSQWPSKDFDREKWKETNEQDRFIYARSLLRSKKLASLTKEEVIQLLGKPSFEDASGEYLTYIVGANAGTVYLIDIRFKKAPAKKVVSEVFLRPD